MVFRGKTRLVDVKNAVFFYSRPDVIFAFFKYHLVASFDFLSIFIINLELMKQIVIKRCLQAPLNVYGFLSGQAVLG